MLLGILYCRLTERQLILSTRYSRVFYHKGWRDFFEPFCPEIENQVLRYLDGRSLPASMKPRVLIRRAGRGLATAVIQPVCYPNLEMMSTFWPRLRALRTQDTFVLANGGLARHCSLREALRIVHDDVWYYNGETAAAISAGIERLSLPRRYAALHIRRGDMSHEIEPIDETRYIERLERATGLQDVYVATDDYRCVESVQGLRRGWRVSSLCPKEMRGYFHDDSERWPHEERRRRTLLLLIETEIMKGAEVFVGTFSSGIGTYQGIARDRGTYGVDSEEWRFEGGL